MKHVVRALKAALVWIAGVQLLTAMAHESWGGWCAGSAGLLATTTFIAFFGFVLLSPVFVLLSFIRRTRPTALFVLAFGLVAISTCWLTHPMMSRHLDSVMRRLDRRSAELQHALDRYIAVHGRSPDDLQQLVPTFLSAIPGTGIGVSPRFEYWGPRSADIPGEVWHYSYFARKPVSRPRAHVTGEAPMVLTMLTIHFQGNNTLPAPERSRWRWTRDSINHSYSLYDTTRARARSARFQWVMANYDSLLPAGASPAEVREQLGPPDAVTRDFPPPRACWLRVRLVPSPWLLEDDRDLVWSAVDSIPLPLLSERYYHSTICRVGRWGLRINDD